MAVWISLSKVVENRVKHAEFTCRGLDVSSQSEVNKNVEIALNQLGIPIKKKIKPKQLTKDDLLKSPIIITMTDMQSVFIKNNFEYKDVFSISNFVDGLEIPDPFGKDVNSYVLVAKQLIYAIDKIFYKLLEVKDGRK